MQRREQAGRTGREREELENEQEIYLGHAVLGNQKVEGASLSFPQQRKELC